jgi:hypothetical protein
MLKNKEMELEGLVLMGLIDVHAMGPALISDGFLSLWAKSWR